MTMAVSEQQVIARFVELVCKDRFTRKLLIASPEFRDLARLVSPNIDPLIEIYAERDAYYRERKNGQTQRAQW